MHMFCFCKRVSVYVYLDKFLCYSHSMYSLTWAEGFLMTYRVKQANSQGGNFGSSKSKCSPPAWKLETCKITSNALVLVSSQKLCIVMDEWHIIETILFQSILDNLVYLPSNWDPLSLKSAWRWVICSFNSYIWSCCIRHLRSRSCT